MNSKRIVAVITLVALVLLSFSVLNAAPSGTLTLAGSTSVQPLAEELAKKFMEKYPDAKIFVQGGGSSAGIKAALNGTADIGNASRDLKDTETGLTKHVIAIDGIAIAVNPKNNIKDIKFEQIQSIFAGEIGSWKDLGVSMGLFASNNITVVNREAGSGTRGAFEEIVMKKSGKEVTTNSIVQGSNGAVKTTVATNKNAIGYISFGYIDDSVKALSVDGAAATMENVKGGTYKIARPFLMVTKGEATGLAKDFLDFVLGSEGQALVKEMGYITVK